MKYSISFLGMVAITGLIFISSCKQQGSAFNNREDSLKFAKAYFDQYPEDNSVKTLLKSDSGSSSAVQPLNWEEVLRFREQYDKHPLIYNLKGEALKGFMVEAIGYDKIKMNNNIKGLYLRFARRDNGAFSIMLLGTDEKGNVIGENQRAQKKSAKDSAEDSDFDNLEPCPIDCPPNFQ